MIMIMIMIMIATSHATPCKTTAVNGPCVRCVQQVSGKRGFGNLQCSLKDFYNKGFPSIV